MLLHKYHPVQVTALKVQVTLRDIIRVLNPI
jgi:hypothetical protein